MEILLSYEDDSSYKNEEFEKIINKVLAKVSELYGLEENSEVSVVLVSDAYIHALNKKYRDKDCATDVLSFALNEGDEPEIIDGPAQNLLGDIIISIDTAKSQAEEYGHSIEREIAFLTVHGILHLLGYDHIEEADRIEMRQEEEYILTKLGINRE
jgi:probable rRNA maturation factor